MKKTFILALVALLFTAVAHAQGSEPMKFKPGSFNETKGNLTGTAGVVNFIDDWPVDANDNECALIRVTLEFFPLDEAKKLQFDVAGSNGFVGKLDDSHLISNNQLWVFITPGSGMQLKANHKTQGVSYGSALITFPQELEAKHVYNVTLTLEKTTTINIGSKPQGAEVWLDGRSIGRTPLAQQAVPFGTHKLRLVLGPQTKEETITVTDMNNVFNDFDLRQKRTVHFDSDPSGSILEILEGGKVVANAQTPCDLELAYGEYTGRATKSGGRKDEHSFSVGPNTTAEHFYPDVRKEVQITGTYVKDGNARETTMKINSKSGNWQQDELSRRETALTHKVLLPYGSYEVTLTTSGGQGKQTITVNNKSKDVYTIKMKDTHSRYTVWEKYEPSPFTLTLGYVQKQMVYRGDGDQYKDPGFFTDFDNGKPLRGVEFGFGWRPAFRWGGGIYTGFYLDYFYYTNNDNAYSLTNNSGSYNNYQELDIYVPVHLMYSLPLGTKCALQVHGGLGFAYGAYAQLADSDNKNISPETKVLGEVRGSLGYDNNTKSAEVYHPKAFNMTAEVGVALRLNKIAIEFNYGKGILEQDCLKNISGYESHQNRLSIGLSWVFGGND